MTFHKQRTIKYKVVLHQHKSQGSYPPEPIQFLKTCRPLHSTRLIFLPLLPVMIEPQISVTPSHLDDRQDVLSEYSIQTRNCRGNRAFGWKIRCSENRARRSPSSEPQFPLQCIEGLWLGTSQRSLYLRVSSSSPRYPCGRGPRVASSEGSAGAQTRRPGRSHSPPLAAIFTCPVSKGDATRKRLPGPPPLPSRESS